MGVGDYLILWHSPCYHLPECRPDRAAAIIEYTSGGPAGRVTATEHADHAETAAEDADDAETLEAKMKQLVIAGTLVGALTLAGGALAQQSQPAGTPQAQPPTATTPSAQTPAKKTPSTATGDQTDKTQKTTTTKRTAHRRAAATGEENAPGTHTAPKQQPNTTSDPNAPDAALALGSVHIPKAVKADGKPLAAGTYQVRLTAEEAQGDDKGAAKPLERWVEFLKGGKVVGREVVSIVPNTETKLVQKDTPPHAGGAKVETLKGGDYVRVWINKNGNYYLIHLVNG